MRLFWKNEDGAVTIDWVLLTASALVMGVVSTASVFSGTMSVVDKEIAALDDIKLGADMWGTPTNTSASTPTATPTTSSNSGSSGGTGSSSSSATTGGGSSGSEVSKTDSPVTDADAENGGN